MDRRKALRMAGERGGSAAFTVLNIYDPTLDVDAMPRFMDDAELTEFEAVDPSRIIYLGSDGRPFEYRTFRGSVRVQAADTIVRLDGRPVHSAFAASDTGGWVRFLAMRETDDGRWLPYAHRWLEPDGRGGLVTGIAFGVIDYLIRKDIGVYG